jgi:hypothetical protein
MCSTAAILGAVITAPAYAQTSTLPNQRGTYRHLEVSFDILGLTTDPLNYETTDVQVKFQSPDGSTVSMPAFFDGGTAWRALHTIGSWHL